MTRPASSGDRRLKSWASPSLGASPCRLERVEELLKNFTPSLLRVNPGEARALLHLEEPGAGGGRPHRSECRPAGRAGAPSGAGTENRRLRFRPGGHHLKRNQPLEGLRRQSPDDPGNGHGLYAVRSLRRVRGGGTGRAYRRRHRRRLLEMLLPPGGSGLSGPRQFSHHPAERRRDLDGGGLRPNGLCGTPVLKGIPACRIRQAGMPFAVSLYWG